MNLFVSATAASRSSMSRIIIYICQNYLYINDDNDGGIYIANTHPGMKLLLTCPTTHDLFFFTLSRPH